MKTKLLLPVLALLLAGCQARLSDSLEPPGASASGRPAEAAPVLHAPAQLAGDRFALDMFRELAATQRGNLVFSPASLETLLRLLREGAAGRTRAELNDLPMGKAKVKSAVALHSANALFVDKGVKLKRQPAALHRVPFATDPSEAVDAINDWGEEETQGLIPRVLNRGDVDGNTRLVALNAVYLNEKWLRPFDEDASEETGRFRKADGSTVRATLMHNTASYRYAEGSDWQAVALFYRRDGRAGEPVCFIGILPKGDARAFAKRLSLQKYNRIRRALAVSEPQELELTLPKMDLECGPLPLVPALMRQGLRSCFSPAAANFSGLTDEKIFVQDVQQCARIIVTEESTEAAAVTTGLIPWLLVDDKARPKALRFDRPFVWAIGDLTTGAAPLFLGICEEP